MAPTVSVILPVYNQEPYLAETIESVLGQSFTDFELLILDDGSKDGSADIIRRYAATDARIHAFFEPNAGKCNATNKLVEKAQAHWCAFLDADDVMLPERLARQVAFHEANPAIGASSCHCTYISPTGEFLGVQRYLGLRTVEECQQALANNEFVKCAFTGFMTSKAAFFEAGGLRNQCWPCDDFDFFNRLIEKGYSLVIMQEILMKYRVHPSSITATKPVHTFEVMDYAAHCTTRRRSNQPEITYAEFKAARDQDPWWKKLDRKRYIYSILYHREASFAMKTRKYLSFSWLLLTASVLSPKFVVATIFNRVTKSTAFQ
ncbi:glycosyltransferase family 2 protein [Hymenobacter fodinae]|uniref:Glycosyltransferase family 2 protein n=1 Tax=Hymenobacter fodinae TaxID=2510796 RepID=A0A4Z0P140_9BACT|nr:glycosyltransferase family 2 protein [Hymenobacter fodinae]TGE04308.1 glycosyltransferase family 2 protein [Hymenobacter fodinae]